MSLTKDQIIWRIKIALIVLVTGFLLFFAAILLTFWLRLTFPLPMFVFPIVFLSIGYLVYLVFQLFYLGFKNPEAVREGLKRHNKAAGGMMSDRLEGVDEKALGDKLSGFINILKGTTGEEDSNKRGSVKVRCAACKTLNDESDKFCGECGQAL